MARRSSNSPHLMGPKPYSSPKLDRKDFSTSPKPDREGSLLNNNSITVEPNTMPDGGDKHVKTITNNQYNSPIGLYGQNTAKETFEDQTKVLLDG